MMTLRQKFFVLFTTTLFTLSFGGVNVAYADLAMPHAVTLDVPFTTQAPSGEWNDPRQKDGCEEASVIMAWMWVQGITLSPEQIRADITGMSDYEQYFYGYYRDSSAEDTANLLIEYFGYSSVTVHHNISLTDIKAELDANKLIIAPINPRIISTKLFNRYTINHTVVVVGYGDGNIIIHDSLHNNGAYTVIPEATFEAALADYRSGQYHKPNNLREKSIIIVSKTE